MKKAWQKLQRKRLKRSLRGITRSENTASASAARSFITWGAARAMASQAIANIRMPQMILFMLQSLLRKKNTWRMPERRDENNGIV